MKIYIVRHGETCWNVQRRLQGASDTELNEKGTALAEITGKALKEVPFSCCFTSPLKKARDTAKLVLGERAIPIYDAERIREISFGVWEGKDSALLPQEMLDNFFITRKSIFPRKEENPCLIFWREQRTSGRTLPPEKNFRTRRCLSHPMAVPYGPFSIMYIRKKGWKITGMGKCRLTAV